MTTMTHSANRAATHSPLRSYVLEAKYELLRILRTPSFALPSLLFPALFYVLFGVLLNRGNAQAAQYLLATYGVFGTMGTGLFAFGVTVAMERERGFLTYKRALPMPPGAYLFAKLVTAMCFAALTSLLLAVLATTLAHVSLAPWQWLALLAANVAGVLPFCAMGLLVGTLTSAQGSPAVVNMLYLPMAFLSGLWLPLTMLPPFFATLAPVFPSYHLAQIALRVVGSGGDAWPIPAHGLLLVGFTALCLLIARRRLARMDGK